MLMMTLNPSGDVSGISSYSSSKGYTLPDLLDQGCEQHPNSRALNQWKNGQWTAVSNHSFRRQADNIALGLQSLGLKKGDRVALLMESDRPFCLVDMACLLAGCVTIPIDLTQTIENIIYILRHAESQALIVSDQALLSLLTPFLGDVPTLKWVIVGMTVGWAGNRKISSLTLDRLPRSLSLQWEDLDDVYQQGESLRSSASAKTLRTAIHPADLATIVYIAGNYDRPKGVMLSHGAIATNIHSAFRVYPHLGTGDTEVALSFLPLTHIFARSFIYGHLAYGHSIYFSNPKRVIKHLKQVQPTIFITVPRLLEKIHSKIIDKGQRLTGWQRWLFDWSLALAQQESSHPLNVGYYAQHTLADRLIFARWRSPFGPRLKTLICGGAALNPTLAQIFVNAGFPLCQGYGLTETSGVLSYERGPHQKAGTIGIPIPGVKVKIAKDGEILVKSPGLMDGYYENPDFTPPQPSSHPTDTLRDHKQEGSNSILPLGKRALEGGGSILDTDGWFHTGDLGRITADGLLQVTGVKKSLFKLSTGKYVSALALEADVVRSPLVADAIAVGAGRKFCAMLIWPNLTTLRQHMHKMGLNIPTTALMHHPCVIALYQSLIDQANCHLPDWSTVKRFVLIEKPLATERGDRIAAPPLQPSHAHRSDYSRAAILQRFAGEIEALYTPSRQQWTETDQQLPPPTHQCPLPPFTCPTYAQSLTH